MNCILLRFPSTLLGTLGMLLDGLDRPLVLTLEPARPLLLLGTWDVALTYSPKFGRNLFEIVNPEADGDPEPDGIRFHPGNTVQETRGCILPGFGFYSTAGALRINDSGAACSALVNTLPHAWRLTVKSLG